MDVVSGAGHLDHHGVRPQPSHFAYLLRRDDPRLGHDDERRRLAGMNNPGERRLFLVAHGAARTILGGITGVPAGDIPLVAWLPTGDQTTAKVTVAPGQVPDVKLAVTAAEKRETHTRKDGTPYGRYK